MGKGNLTNADFSEWPPERLIQALREAGSLIERLKSQVQGISRQFEEVKKAHRAEIAKAEEEARYWKEYADSLEFKGEDKPDLSPPEERLQP